MDVLSDVFDKVGGAEVDPELLAQWLESSGRFRVLRRVESKSDFGGAVSLPLRVLVLDTETTGLVFGQAELIEVGAVLLEVDRETGVLGRVLGAYGGLEEPVQPIPEESTAIHGITNEMVRGLRFDESVLGDLVARAELCVAHNAGFDKPFLLRRFGFFEETRWACSLKEVPWEQEGYEDRRLGGLLAECGYFHDAHRAVEDCHALIWVLSKALKSSHRMPFQVLFESADLPIYLIAALKAPFEKKDALKARGFRWNADERVWEFEALGFAAGKEVIEWLRSVVYGTQGKVMLGFRTQAGVDRYSSRPAKQQFKEV